MKRYLLLTTAILCPAFAQNGAIPAFVGYSAPPAFLAAPGQVVTLFLHGIPPASDGTLRSAAAAAGTLPPTLAGISVQLAQDKSQQAGIFAVRQQDECGQTVSVDPACLLTAVKVQFPFEMVGDPVLNDQKFYVYRPLAQLRVDVDGRTGRQFPLQPAPDNSHVLTTCDASWDTAATSTCDRLLYHSDGSVINQQAPAKIGEAVYVLLYGLGKTSPEMPTGQTSPAGVVSTDVVPGSPRVGVRLEANVINAPSSLPRLSSYSPKESVSLIPVAPASLVPGQIGIYQLNFAIPAPKDSIYPCGDSVRSNSIILIETSQGIEQIGVCV